MYGTWNICHRETKKMFGSVKIIHLSHHIQLWNRRKFYLKNEQNYWKITLLRLFICPIIFDYVINQKFYFEIGRIQEEHVQKEWNRWGELCCYM
jgi:hypothetical protein